MVSPTLFQESSPIQQPVEQTFSISKIIVIIISNYVRERNFTETCQYLIPHKPNILIKAILRRVLILDGGGVEATSLVTGSHENMEPNIFL